MRLPRRPFAPVGERQARATLPAPPSASGKRRRRALAPRERRIEISTASCARQSRRAPANMRPKRRARRGPAAAAAAAVACSLGLLLAALAGVNCDTSKLGPNAAKPNNKPSHEAARHGARLQQLAEQVARQHQMAGAAPSFLQRQPSASSSAAGAGGGGGGGQRPQDAYFEIYKRHLEGAKSSGSSASGADQMSRIALMHELASSPSAERKKSTSGGGGGGSEQASLDSAKKFAAKLRWLPASLSEPANALLSQGPSGLGGALLAFGAARADQSARRANASSSLLPAHAATQAGPPSGAEASSSGGKSARGLSTLLTGSRAGKLAATLQRQLLDQALGLSKAMLLAPGAAAARPNANEAHDKEAARKAGLLRGWRARLGPDEAAGAESSAATSQQQPIETQASASAAQAPAKGPARATKAGVGSWISKGANQLAQSYLQDSLRDLLTLSQLPILSSASTLSTAPSDLEPGGRLWLAQRAAAQQARANRTSLPPMEDLLRYAYILGSGVRRKRDPLKALGPKPARGLVPAAGAVLSARPARNALQVFRSRGQAAGEQGNKAAQLMANLNSMLVSNRHAKPRGVMWEMATDPTLAVTVMHLLERASVALPLGFLLMPFVQMVRTNPLHNIPIDLARILPARASHRSVDYEELAKRLDIMDKILSRALRPTHREAPSIG